MPTKHKSATPAKNTRVQPTRRASANAAKASAPRRTTKQAPARVVAQPPAPPAPRDSSKQAQLIVLLRSTAGATVMNMMELTGWQPHTVRGTISGVLRKKLSLNVTSEASDSGRIYRIVDAA